MNLCVLNQSQILSVLIYVCRDFLLSYVLDTLRLILNQNLKILIISSVRCRLPKALVDDLLCLYLAVVVDSRAYASA